MTFALRPVQTEALEMLAAQPRPLGGLLGVPVGGGKTIIALLAPKYMGAQRPLLVTPASLRAQTIKDHDLWGPRFGVAPVPHISYAQISRDPELLRKLNPDLIIFDEGHYLKSPTSARTRRVFDHFTDFPDTRAVFMSGSFAKASVNELWHLALLALRETSPLPHTAGAAAAIANVTDVGAEPAPGQVKALRKYGRCPRTILAGVGRALREASGVLLKDQGFSGPIRMGPVRHRLTPRVTAALRLLQREWELPDGTPLVDATEPARHAATLAWGFWQEWDWAAIGGIDEEWNEARLEWNRTVRHIKAYGGRRLDSLTTIVEAIERGELDEAAPAYLAWLEVADRPKPPKRAVILDPTAADPILDEVERMGEGIVWYRSPALGGLLAQHMPVYGRGDGFPAKAPVVALSSEVYGTGVDGLQHIWHKNLILQAPSDVEQLLGRTHRPGQRDEVVAGFVTTTRSQKRSLMGLRQKATFSEDFLAQSQKLLGADWHDPLRWG